MSTKPNSLEAAASEVIDRDPAGGAIFGQDVEPRQLDLLRGKDGRLPSNVFRLARNAPERVRGPGRPKGSQNKRSTDLAKLLAAKFPDPVQYMASIYAMPLDQFCETLLIADGTIERREQLDELLIQLAGQVRELALADTTGSNAENIDRLADACEALEAAARRGAAKPGEVAIKALNIQLAAAKSVAEYWHSKKPVEATVTHKMDGVLVMPGMGGNAASFEDQDKLTRMAADGIAKMLANGRIEPGDIAGLQLVDGQLLLEGECAEVECGEVGDA